MRKVKLVIEFPEDIDPSAEDAILETINDTIREGITNHGGSTVGFEVVKPTPNWAKRFQILADAVRDLSTEAEDVQTSDGLRSVPREEDWDWLESVANHYQSSRPVTPLRDTRNFDL